GRSTQAQVSARAKTHMSTTRGHARVQATITLLNARQEYFAVGGVSFCAEDGRRERRPLAWRQAVCLYPGRSLVVLTDGFSPPDAPPGSQAAIRKCRASAWHVAAWHVAATKCTSWLRPSWGAPCWRAPKLGRSSSRC